MFYNFFVSILGNAQKFADLPLGDLEEMIAPEERKGNAGTKYLKRLVVFVVFCVASLLPQSLQRVYIINLKGKMFSSSSMD